MVYTVKMVIQNRCFLSPALILVCFLISPVFMAAHEGQDVSDHSIHYELELKPGESKTFNITWADQPLKARWIFLLSARMTGDAGATVKMYAPDSEKPFLTWDWPVDGNVHTQVTELPEDGFYELAFFNSEASPEAVAISFQYDQSCECTGKLLDLDGGVVIFQQKVEKDEVVRFAISEPESTNLFVWSGVRNNNPLTWKDGFDLTATGIKSQRRITVDYTAEVSGVHYLFVESIFGTGYILPEYSQPIVFDAGKDDGRSKRLVWFAAIGLILLTLTPLIIIALKKRRAQDMGNTL